MRKLLIILAISIAGQVQAEGELVRGPYLQQSTDSSVVVVWRSHGEMTPVIRCRLDGKAVKAVVTLAESRKLSGEDEGILQYEATVSGLQPDRRYDYEIFDGERVIARGEGYSFLTHPKPGTPRSFRALVLGDSGTGGQFQAAVYEAFRAWEKRHEEPVELFLHVGDMAYGKGKNAEFQRNFFDVYQPTLKRTVCWAAMGNHEGYTSNGLTQIGPYYDAYVLPKQGEAGGAASGSESYYSFDYGRVHFVVLNSHDVDRKPTGAMARWLKADLAATKDRDFVIAFWHHPPYTKGTHDSDREPREIDMRTNFMPMLEDWGVDLVLAGHSHVYERSYLIDRAYATPSVKTEEVLVDDGDGDPAGDGAYLKQQGLNAHQGTVAVVTGHGGRGVGRKALHPLMVRSLVKYGSFLIEVEGQRLIGRMLGHDGKIDDTFVIDKSATLAPPRRRVPVPIVEVAIKKGDDWAYRVGDAAAGWQDGKAKDGWLKGKAGFGYGDDDDATDLELEMKGKELSVCIWREFTLADPSAYSKAYLEVSYDDAFEAWINGKPVAKANLDKDGGAARRIEPTEFVRFPIPLSSLKTGRNVLAVRGVNRSTTSSDLTLHPTLKLVVKP